MMKIASIATLLLACGASIPAPPPLLEGRWTYEAGSTIVADCEGAPEQTIDLSKAAPAGQPGYFVLSAADAGGLHEVDARGCQYDWDVSGGVATARGGQSCDTFPDGRGGNRLVHLLSGTKSSSDGASMAVDVRFSTDAPSSCAIRVQGTATKS